MLNIPPKLKKIRPRFPLLFFSLSFLVVASSLSFYGLGEIRKLKSEVSSLTGVEKQLELNRQELQSLKKQDQYKINQKLNKEIEDINATYKKAATSYESLDDVSLTTKKTDEMKKDFATILNFLSERNYSSASAAIALLDMEIKKEKDRIASSFSSAQDNANIVSSNSPPGSGYQRQRVGVLESSFVVDVVAADLSSTRIIVDTASDSDCRDNCPVLSLSDYISRNGAWAGINGSYFCPASYPTCAGRANAFDTLLMNKNKVYFNSENNVYSNVPAAIFLPGSIRFVGRSLEWGRDTGADGVLANQPLLVSGGNIVFGGDGDPKKGSRGTRSFVGSKGNIAYIGVVHNVTVAEMAHVLAALGLENALNLDSGGSTALWAGGYKAGPGRNIPNAILFVSK